MIDTLRYNYVKCLEHLPTINFLVIENKLYAKTHNGIQSSGA